MSEPQRTKFDFPKDTHDPNEMDLGRADRIELEKRNKRRRERDNEDMKKVLGMVEGRRVLAKILYRACVFSEIGDMIESSFNANSMSMAYTEGSRRLGFILMNEIKRADRGALIQIQRERESDLATDLKKEDEPQKN